MMLRHELGGMVSQDVTVRGQWWRLLSCCFVHHGIFHLLMNMVALYMIGSVVESDLLDALVSGRATPQDAVGGHMSAPLPMIGSGEQVSRAVEALEKAGAAVVLVDGRPSGLITRQDLLTFLASTP